MDSNAAIVDILNNPRYQGAMSSIKGVTQFLDMFFIQFISLIAFFIISSAMLRNVVAGAYAAYPIFFDKVNEAKMAAQEKIKGKGPKGIGSIGCFLLGLLPDFKEMSEFRDDNIQPRDYFLKAIPLMFAVVMIGVTIYNGYYRDVATKVAYLGSELIHRFIVNVDPVEVWDQITNTVGTPDMPSGSDTTTKGKYVNSLSKDIYSKTVSFYTDIKSVEAKNKLATSVETATTTRVNSIGDAYFTADWKPTFEVVRSYGSPTLNAKSNDETETYIKQFSIPLSELQIDSGMHKGQTWTYTVTCTFIKQHKGVQSLGSVAADVTIGTTKLKVVNSSPPSTTITINTTSGTWMVGGAATVTINGTSHSITKSSTYLTIAGYSATSGATGTMSGVSYLDPDNQSHTIGNVTFGGTGGIVFKYTDSSGTSKTFTEGQSPAAGEKK